jgi:trimethylamine--corrinoid protein Co-methyltransferase
MDHFREAHFHPKLLNRARYDSWKEEGGDDLYARCNSKAQKILSNHVVKPKPVGMLDEIEHILSPPRKIMAV